MCLDATSIAIILPTSVLTAFCTGAYVQRFRRFGFSPEILKKSSKQLTSRSELLKIASLKGTNAAELNTLIDFYSHIGNFKKADEYSRKLIEMD